MTTKREPNRYICQLANGRWQLKHPFEPPRTYSQRVHAQKRLGRLLAGDTTKRTHRRFTEDEDLILARLWRNKTNTPEYVVSFFKDRTYSTLKCRARALNLSRIAEREASIWKPEEIEIVVRHVDDRVMMKKLLPGRSVDAINNKISGLGLLNHGGAWSPEENRLIETIYKARAKLLKTRHKSSIRDKLHSLQQREYLPDQILIKVREAMPVHLPIEIREEVHHAVLIAVLENKRLLIDLPGTIKSIVTQTYGPRTYSLDAPLFDGSGMNWIDTIESERPHF